MHKTHIIPLKSVVLPESNSLLTIGDSQDDRTYLLHRIDLLQLENEELKRREEHLRRINVALTDALGSKNHQPDDLKNTIR